MADRPPPPSEAPGAPDDSTPRTAPQIPASIASVPQAAAPADSSANRSDAAKTWNLPAVTRGWLLIYALFWYGVLVAGLSIGSYAVPVALPYIMPLLFMAPILLRAAMAPQRLGAAVFHDGWPGFAKSALEGLAATALLPVWLGGVIFLMRQNADWANFLVAGESQIKNWPDFLSGMAAVSIGEELFFRGFLQHELSMALCDRPHLKAWRLGRGYLLATVLFAVAHVVLQGGAGLLTFFPALIFGWLYARRRQIVGPAIFHFACNILVAVAAAAGVFH